MHFKIQFPENLGIPISSDGDTKRLELINNICDRTGLKYESNFSVSSAHYSLKIHHNQDIWHEDGSIPYSRDTFLPIMVYFDPSLTDCIKIRVIADVLEQWLIDIGNKKTEVIYVPCLMINNI
ncbi:MAG TPA: hypothetical protein PLI45_02590 [Candidatus Woesebacteria bacterium]|nr:hypothetical protein [Candidatus Woesebacteria bacterium]